DALIGLAEALSAQDESQLSGRAGKLIEQALLLVPNSPKALFFGAAAAVHRGDLPLARQRFAALLALDPPETVRPIIEQQIAAIDKQIAAGGTGSSAGTVASGGPAIHIRVALSPKLHLSRDAGAPLFVFVRDPKQPGPPLAVKRLETRLPQTVDLSAADAMIPGRAIAEGEDVQVVARIARSGSAIARSGDPFGEIAYRVGRDGIVDVVIDRLTP
ncbi:MAG TPA: hypothetical protein VEV18_04025, partial [Steroidobacteraceae bacterium]|nr:hypothetical protein [Steroidobacteraceae bacterium]